MSTITSPRTLYVSDLDRTLLRSDGTLGQLSVELLNEVIDRGGLFTIATARSPASARKATAGLRMTLPIITYGGTVTADPVTGTAYDVRFTQPDVVTDVIRAAKDHANIEPIFFTFEDGRDWIRWDPSRMTVGVEVFLSKRGAKDRRLRPILGDDPLDVRTVHYVSILAKRPDLVAFRAENQVTMMHVAHFLSTDPGTPGLDWLEFHHPDGTKAAAVQRLRADVKAHRLVAFGDNHNDAPMFEIADEAHAVQNSVPELVAIATSVIDHHEDDAVARFIASEMAGVSRS
ncbi:hypothetical protein DY023_09730 [Microbacterium bovistercoris]|uniref:HAD family phosphatase n=1 Tax=Microbacterium bovistercoris TaxID=2293570 RepID=A0A371NTD7_9MICO|nr:HAD family hydrolase [Microbacterium bovistercoris]REJ05511.1 hypothetical protein DY023_09730 [Microbacterium bovistercoris]